MKRSRLLLVLIGGIFFVAVISLYHMLELMQKIDFGTEKGLPGRQVDEVRNLCEIRFMLLTVSQDYFKFPLTCRRTQNRTHE